MDYLSGGLRTLLTDGAVPGRASSLFAMGTIVVFDRCRCPVT